MTERRTDLEDLCALGRRGLLSEAEERELERALRTSPSLRSLHEVGVDLDRSTAVRAGDEALIARAADAALARVAKSGLSPRKAPAPGPRRRSLAVLLAAALVCVTGVAAAVWSGVVPRIFGGTHQKTEAFPEGTPAAQHAARGPAPEPAPTNPNQKKDPAGVLTEAIDVPAAFVGPSDSNATSRASQARASSDPTAAALFSAANTARRDGDFGRAKKAYSELISRYPASDEARLARVSLGKLLLAKGNPSGAAKEFDEYLKGGHGQLTEEALVSRAQSLQKLGKASAERQTWQGLLAEYPNSVYSAEARRRLDALRREATSSAP